MDETAEVLFELAEALSIRIQNLNVRLLDIEQGSSSHGDCYLSPARPIASSVWRAQENQSGGRVMCCNSVFPSERLESSSIWDKYLMADMDIR